MNIGDVVVCKRNAYRIGHDEFTFTLRSGCGAYTHAIVASLDPFVLVSEEADMMWRATVKPEYFQALCRADEAIVNRALRRLKNG